MTHHTAIQIVPTESMKHKSIIALSLFPHFLVSCTNLGGNEDYDVANPYAAPDYAYASGTPNLPSDVNPAYSEAAVYEENTTAALEPTYTPSAAVAQTKVHTIVRGDSLWSISKKYGVSIDAIKQANGMTKDIVVLDTKLNIPVR